MPHTTEELLLAAHVRELASRWLIADTPAHLVGPELRRQWRREHIDEYIAGATNELLRVAAVVKSVQAVAAAESRPQPAPRVVDSQPAPLQGADDVLFVNGRPLSASPVRRQ